MNLQQFITQFKNHARYIKNKTDYPYIIFNLTQKHHNNYFNSIQSRIIKSNAFNNHQMVVLSTDLRYKCIFAVFVHQVNRGPAQGGLRYYNYNTLNEIIDDGLKLSESMSRKAALAGLNCGGGKGIIAYNTNSFSLNTIARRELFEDYGRFVSSLNGIYHTAGDIGTNTKDINHIYNQTRYVTCIDTKYGGSGNPSYYTAKGLITCLKTMTNLRNASISIQGLGNVSQYVIDMLLQNNVGNIYVSDINTNAIHQYFSCRNSKLMSNIHVVQPDEIYASPSDIFIPNALGGTLNKQTIPNIKANIICGTANNQLSEESDAELLAKYNKTWIPDYIVNRMGLVNCANENYGRLVNDPEIEKHYSSNYPHSLGNTLKDINRIAIEERCNLNTAANFLADSYIKHPHPIFGNRFNDIIVNLSKRQERLSKYNVEL